MRQFLLESKMWRDCEFDQHLTISFRYAVKKNTYNVHVKVKGSFPTVNTSVLFL